MKHEIQWPDSVDPQHFLNDYWQQKSLFIPQALPAFDSPISPDELAGLALEEDTNPRLILHHPNDEYSIEFGPFTEQRFSQLEKNDWSLLVTDVEKHIPEFVEYLQAFAFLPRWRMDDLMISYAPIGASVGAHVDEYDVFLLQASGTRRWSIDNQAQADCRLRTNSSLRLLAQFNPDQHIDTVPGDLLYLPAGVPHHGIATSDDCTTWSFGFRAPSQTDVLTEFSALLADKLSSKRFRDPANMLATQADTSGELHADSINALADLWHEATRITPQQLVELSGRLVTQTAALEIPREAVSGEDNPDARWAHHPFSRFAYVRVAQGAQLFVDGQSYHCSLAFAQCVCQWAGEFQLIANDYAPTDQHVLHALLAEGCLISAA